MSVTSGIIFSAEEYTIPSLIGTSIFNNGIKFRMGEEETFREMICADREKSKGLQSASERDGDRAVD